MSDRVTAWIQDRRNAQTKATPGAWEWEGKSDEAWPSGENSLRAGDEIVLFGWGYDASGIEASPEDEAAIVDAHNEFPKALTALEAVLELHKPLGYIDRFGDTAWDECEECGQGWPCDTYTAIESALEAEE